GHNPRPPQLLPEVASSDIFSFAERQEIAAGSNVALRRGPWALRAGLLRVERLPLSAPGGEVASVHQPVQGSPRERENLSDYQRRYHNCRDYLGQRLAGCGRSADGMTAGAEPDADLRALGGTVRHLRLGGVSPVTGDPGSRYPHRFWQAVVRKGDAGRCHRDG